MTVGPNHLAALVTPSLTALGYELVRVQLIGAGPTPTLQIMIERKDLKTITVEDCTTVSHALSALLDVEDPLNGGSYRLEISSPGIDRPLTRMKDYERFAGYVVRVETKLPIDGRKRFQGTLKGLEDGAVSLTLDDGASALLSLGDIHKAKLVLTDELLAAAAREQGLVGQKAAEGNEKRSTNS